MFGLKGESSAPAKPATSAPTPAAVAAPEQTSAHAQDADAVPAADQEEVFDQEAQEQAELEAAMAGGTPPAEAPAVEEESSNALNNAMAYLMQDAPAEDAAPEQDSAQVEAADNTATQKDAGVTKVAATVERAAETAAVADKPTRPAPAPEKKPKDDVKRPAAEKDDKAEKAEKPSAPQAPAAQPAEAPGELSRAERREGLAIADGAAVAQYPGLKLGDKYYTAHSRAVQAGLKKPGGRYKGDNREKALDLTESGPRRARRRLTS
jgi:hypothetical protein